MYKPYVTAVAVLALVALVALVAVGTPASAGDPVQRPNQSPKGDTVTDDAVAVGDVGLAHALAEYGRRQQDPLALLAAAKILKTTSVEEMKTRPVTHREEGVDAEEKSESAGAPVTAEVLIEEARGLSGEDASLAGVATAVESERSRGRMGGPGCGTWRLPARSVQTITETFVAGELARVVLRGDGDTDLDLFIFDENGNLIDSDTDATDFCICSWVPRWTGPFVIRVENLGRVWNQYSVCTN